MNIPSVLTSWTVSYLDPYSARSLALTNKIHYRRVSGDQKYWNVQIQRILYPNFLKKLTGLTIPQRLQVRKHEMKPDFSIAPGKNPMNHYVNVLNITSFNPKSLSLLHSKGEYPHEFRSAHFFSYSKKDEAIFKLRELCHLQDLKIFGAKSLFRDQEKVEKLTNVIRHLSIDSIEIVKVLVCWAINSILQHQVSTFKHRRLSKGQLRDINHRYTHTIMTYRNLLLDKLKATLAQYEREEKNHNLLILERHLSEHSRIISGS